MAKKPKFNPKRHSKYHVQNTDKYIGKTVPICRSTWEYSFCRWCDTNPNILEWASEPLSVPYFDPTTQKKRNYYPDFLIKVINKNDEVETWLIEIKPNKETKPPRNTKNKKNKTLMNEKQTYRVNQAKWGAAQKVCDIKGWKFKILTEKTIMKS